MLIPKHKGRAGGYINAAFIAFNHIMITLKRAFLWLARKL